MRQVQQAIEKGTWFEEWFNSPFYPLLYGNRDEAEASRFVDTVLRFLSPAVNARFLDLACGQGRLARQLAARGFEVTGVDISEKAIALARHSAADRLEFYQHDMRRVFRPDYFDYIFNFFTSFGYFEQEQDHLDTLHAVRQGLRPGGRFVLDYLNSVKVAAELVEHDEKQVGEVHFHLHRRIEDGHFVKDIDIQHGNQQLHFQERVRAFTREDFQMLFDEAGLDVLHQFGDYQLRPFQQEASDRLILIAAPQSGFST